MSFKLSILSLLAGVVLLVPDARADERSMSIEEACDSLTVWMRDRTGVDSTIKLKNQRFSKGSADLYFTNSFGDYPWTAADMSWARDILSSTLPSGTKLGRIFCNGVNVEDYLVKHTFPDPWDGVRFIERCGEKSFPKGLDGRGIALWQSHGLYYDDYEGMWRWQRPPMNTTVEDMFTQSYVLKYLIPMLENAGAYVITPRERDTQADEIVTDNDKSFDRKGLQGRIRYAGTYSEHGRWQDAGVGFADTKAVYSGLDNPFAGGSSRMAECSGDKADCSVSWEFVVPRRGFYAVYISYASRDNSNRKAHYCINHMGGRSEYLVDQTRGGGTWIYLGTFEFEGQGSVVLDNRGDKGRTVSADAVRVGGGMGRIDRGGGISGVPAYCEGAMYNMQWSGVDQIIWNGHETDYTNDFASRGAWAKSMRDDRHLPVDLSLAFHSDAGVAAKDTTVGTLAIYTLKCEGKRTMSNGLDRMSCRQFAQTVQDEVVKDIRAGFCPDWNRRQIWDRSYSECRTTDVPGMILELLSHQNFNDMRYGLDPRFQFTVSRAVYKGMLKFLSSLYGRPYVVQPLPVRNFSVVFESEEMARLSWEASTDSLEASASPAGYKIFTRIDDGAFDEGRFVSGTSVTMAFKPGHVYSYRVVAWNEGGYSFPSETLCIGVPEATTFKPGVLIVNNFTRLSAPSYINSDQIAGFDGIEDSGVPYIDDISYVGRVYDFQRDHEWISDNEAGWGACYSDAACGRVAGNTFDFPAVHAKELLRMGHSFCSTSVGAYVNALSGADGEPVADPYFRTLVTDLICGKQTDAFPLELQDALRKHTAAGHSLLVSGANIASPFIKDTLHFASDVLGFRWISSHASPDGKVNGMHIFNTPNELRYSVQNPDALGLRSGSKALASGSVVLRYECRNLPAAVHFTGNGYKVASYGFPLECLDDEKDFRRVLQTAMEFLTK